MKQMHKAGKRVTKSQVRFPRLKILRYRSAIPFILLFMLAAFAPDLIITSVTAAQPNKSLNILHAANQKVLALHSYHNNMGWTRAIEGSFEEEQLHGQSGITGVNEVIDIQGTIELVYRTHLCLTSYSSEKNRGDKGGHRRYHRAQAGGRENYRPDR